MMTHFVKQGAAWRVSATGDMVVKDKLPPGNYTVKQDQYGNFFLETIASFEVPSRIYGDPTEQAERIVRTFLDRTGKSTGVLLTGEKGSGKTMLAKLVCVHAAKEGMPTIVINHPWNGDQFNSFIQSIEQSALIMFDEFEKVYDRDEQEQILTLLDGVYPTHKLFLITCNNKWKLDANLINRPGRVYYNVEFSGLDYDFIEEYCLENLQETSYISKIQKVSALFQDFNFDLLQALVEEMNRYGETPQEALRMLNIKPESGNDGIFLVELTRKGVDWPQDQLGELWEGNPLYKEIDIEYRDHVEHDGETDLVWCETTFRNTDLVSMDAKLGQFIYVNDKDEKLCLTKRVLVDHNYLAF